MPDCVECSEKLWGKTGDKTATVKMKLCNFGIWECPECGYQTTYTDEELLQDIYNEEEKE